VNTGSLEKYRSGVFALVGCGDAIGVELADQCAKLGMRPVLVDSTYHGRLAIERLRERGVAALAYDCDLTDSRSLADTAAKMGADGDTPTILWINVGIGIHGGFLTTSEPTIDRIFEVNVLSAVRIARAFVPMMQRAKRPRHLGITASSGSVTTVSGDACVYQTTEHAVLALGEGLRAELKAQDIGVTLLLNGSTDIRSQNHPNDALKIFWGGISVRETVEDHCRNGKFAVSKVAAAAFEGVGGGGGYAGVLANKRDIDLIKGRMRDICSGFKVSVTSTG
jgi:NAD(P)-dependent dehydrogenase (short-subunit alcohol dehydrogenase family)